MILYTEANSGVGILIPSPWYLTVVRNGGGFISSGRVKYEIEKDISRGMDPDTARRNIHALAFGGCTTAEALAIIIAKDAPIGAHDFSISGNLPDRWFRSAWRRKKKIWIDIDEARKIQAHKIINARQEILKKYEPGAMLGHNYAAMRYGMAKDFDPISYGRKLNAARTPEELRALWPDELRSDPKA